MAEQVSRSFVQCVMARGILTRQQAEEQVRRLAALYGAEGLSLDHVLERTNRKLSPLDFEIRATISENDGIQYIVMINARADPIAQKFTAIVKPNEARFCKILVSLEI
jgi:hypothetical protein